MNARVIAAGLLSLGAFQAHALYLTPSTTDMIAGYGYGPSNCEPGCVEEVFDAEDLILLYKADVPKLASDPVAESGVFALSYQTQFTNTSTDPSGATISGSGITCGTCYLAIKDGGQSPGYYFFDLGFAGWDGSETITLADFWPGKGAISHISIWGDRTSVPEPGTLSLLGAGLLLAGWKRRKQLFR